MTPPDPDYAISAGGPPQDDAARRAEDLSRIEAGDIPLAALWRVRELAKGSLFTSGMSVNEFALAHKLGVRPLGQVMGASIHQVGYQWIAGGWRGEQLFCELDVVSQAWDHARRRALGRLLTEARELHAHAVVGVRLHRGAHDWAAGCVDYVITGTAVGWAGKAPDTPALTDLDAQDYYKLVRAGYAPVGLCAATSVFFVSPSSSARWQRAMTVTANQELPEYSQGVYAARNATLDRLSAQANQVHADGIVGVGIDHHVRRAQVQTTAGGGSGNQRGGLEVTFHATGTAIRHLEREGPARPQMTMSLGAGADVQ